MPNNFKIFNATQDPQKTLAKVDYDNNKDVIEGFTSGEVINSKVFNTVLNAVTKFTKALLDAIPYSTTIDESSTEDQIESYIKNGLKAYIEKTSPPTEIIVTNNNTNSNSIVNFSVNGQNYNKTINNVQNATNATFADNFQRKITVTLTNDAGGSYTFTGQNDAILTVPVTVNRAHALKSGAVGDDTHPVYFDGNGRPVRILKVANASQADNAVNAAALHSINIGDSTHPVYFNDIGRPTRIEKVQTSMFAERIKSIDDVLLVRSGLQHDTIIIVGRTAGDNDVTNFKLGYSGQSSLICKSVKCTDVISINNKKVVTEDQVPTFSYSNGILTITTADVVAAQAPMTIPNFEDEPTTIPLTEEDDNGNI